MKSPSSLACAHTKDIIAPSIQEIISNTRFFITENVRTSRRFISALKLRVQIEGLDFRLLNKDTQPTELEKILEPLMRGNNMGLMSEAGLPAIADPGQIAVAMAHQLGITVVPLPGPSSIIQALISC